MLDFMFLLIRGGCEHAALGSLSSDLGIADLFF